MLPMFRETPPEVNQIRKKGHGRRGGPGKKLKLSEISEAVSLIVSSDEITFQILRQKDGEQKE
jgi:hypothetical protein